MPLSLWFREELLRAHFHWDTYEPDFINVAVALCLRVPPADVDVTQLDEPVNVEYARSERGLLEEHWALTGYGEITNVAALLWPEAVTTWGVCVGWALVTADARAGHPGFTERVMATGRLANPLRIMPGVQPRLPAGALVTGLR